MRPGTEEIDKIVRNRGVETSCRCPSRRSIANDNFHENLHEPPSLASPTSTDDTRVVPNIPTKSGTMIDGKKCTQKQVEHPIPASKPPPLRHREGRQLSHCHAKATALAAPGECRSGLLGGRTLSATTLATR